MPEQTFSSLPHMADDEVEAGELVAIPATGANAGDWTQLSIVQLINQAIADFQARGGRSTAESLRVSTLGTPYTNSDISIAGGGIGEAPTLTFVEPALSAWDFDSNTLVRTLLDPSAQLVFPAGQAITGIMQFVNDSATDSDITEWGLRLVKNRGIAGEAFFPILTLTTDFEVSANSNVNVTFSTNTVAATINFVTDDTLEFEIYFVTAGTDISSNGASISTIEHGTQSGTPIGTTVELTYDNTEREWVLTDENGDEHAVFDNTGEPEDDLKAYIDGQDLIPLIFYQDTDTPNTQYTPSQFTWDTANNQFNIPSGLLRTRPATVSNSLYFVIVFRTLSATPTVHSVLPTLPFSITGSGGGVPFQFSSGAAAPNDADAVSGTNQLYIRDRAANDIASVSYSSESNTTWTTVESAGFEFSHNTTTADDANAHIGTNQIYFQTNSAFDITHISYSHQTQSGWATLPLATGGGGGDLVSEIVTYWKLNNNEPDPVASYTVVGTAGVDGHLAPQTSNRFYDTPAAAIAAANPTDLTYPLWKIPLVNLNNGQRIVTTDVAPVGHNRVVTTYGIWTRSPAGTVPVAAVGTYDTGSETFTPPTDWSEDPGSLSAGGGLFYNINTVNTNNGTLSPGTPVLIASGEISDPNNLGTKIANATLSAGTLYSFTTDDPIGGWTLESGIPTGFSIEQIGGLSAAVNLPRARVDGSHIGYWIIGTEGTSDTHVYACFVPVGNGNNQLIGGTTDTLNLRVDPLVGANSRLLIESTTTQSLTPTVDMHFGLYLAVTAEGERGADGRTGRTGLPAVAQTEAFTFTTVGDTNARGELHSTNDSNSGVLIAYVATTNQDYWLGLEVGDLITIRHNDNNYVTGRITQVDTQDSTTGQMEYDYDVLDVVGYVNGRGGDSIHLDSARPEHGTDGDHGRKGINAVSDSISGTFYALADVTQAGRLHWINDANIGNFTIYLADADIEYWSGLRVGTLVTGRYNDENYIQTRITSANSTSNPYLYEFEVLDTRGQLNGRTGETIHLDSSQAEDGSHGQGINTNYQDGDTAAAGTYVRYEGLEYYVLQTDDGTHGPPDEQPMYYRPLASAKLRAIHQEPRIRDSVVSISINKHSVNDANTSTDTYSDLDVTFNDENARNSWTHEPAEYRYRLDGHSGTMTVASGQTFNGSSGGTYSVANPGTNTDTIAYNRVGTRMVKNKGLASEEIVEIHVDTSTHTLTPGSGNTIPAGTTSGVSLDFDDGDTVTFEIFVNPVDSTHAGLLRLGTQGDINFNATTGIVFSTVVSDIEFDETNRVWGVRDEQDVFNGMFTPAGEPTAALKEWHDERDLGFVHFYADTTNPTNRYANTDFTWNATDDQFDIPSGVLRDRPDQVTHNLYLITITHNREDTPIVVNVFPTLPLTQEIQKPPAHVETGFTRYEPINSYASVPSFDNFACWSFSRSVLGDQDVNLCDVGFYSIAADGTATLIEDDVTFQSNYFGRLDLNEIGARCTSYRIRDTNPIPFGTKISVRLKKRYAQIVGTISGSPGDLDMDTGVFEVAYSNQVGHINWSALGDSGIPMLNPIAGAASDHHLSGISGQSFLYATHFKVVNITDFQVEVGDDNDFPRADLNEDGIAIYSQHLDTRNNRQAVEDIAQDSIMGMVCHNVSGNNDNWSLFANGTFEQTNTAQNHSAFGLRVRATNAYLGDVFYTNQLNSAIETGFNDNILKTKFDETGLFGHLYSNVEIERIIRLRFSADGSTDWHTTRHSGDSYIAWSIDDGKNWSASVLIEEASVQYSVNGSSNWHDTRANDDVYWSLVIRGHRSPAIRIDADTTEYAFKLFSEAQRQMHDDVHLTFDNRLHWSQGMQWHSLPQGVTVDSDGVITSYYEDLEITFENILPDHNYFFIQNHSIDDAYTQTETLLQFERLNSAGVVQSSLNVFEQQADSVMVPTRAGTTLDMTTAGQPRSITLFEGEKGRFRVVSTPGPEGPTQDIRIEGGNMRVNMDFDIEGGTYELEIDEDFLVYRNSNVPPGHVDAEKRIIDFFQDRLWIPAAPPRLIYGGAGQTTRRGPAFQLNTNDLVTWNPLAQEDHFFGDIDVITFLEGTNVPTYIDATTTPADNQVFELAPNTYDIEVKLFIDTVTANDAMRVSLMEALLSDFMIGTHTWKGVAFTGTQFFNLELVGSEMFRVWNEHGARVASADVDIDTAGDDWRGICYSPMAERLFAIATENDDGTDEMQARAWQTDGTRDAASDSGVISTDIDSPEGMTAVSNRIAVLDAENQDGDIVVYTSDWFRLANEDVTLPTLTSPEEYRDIVYAGDADDGYWVLTNTRIQFISHSGTVEPSREISLSGISNDPTGIEIDRTDLILFVQDNQNNQIRVFNETGGLRQDTDEILDRKYFVTDGNGQYAPTLSIKSKNFDRTGQLYVWFDAWDGTTAPMISANMLIENLSRVGED